MTLAALTGLLLLWGMSMVYVYRFRGRARYASLSQYLRKSWPIFALPNCVLYASTRTDARRPFLGSAEFHELGLIRTNWKAIRAEALALCEAGGFEAARTPGSPASYDVGFRTFYKYGWSRFYLHWYGYTHPSAKAMCPLTTELLQGIPQVRAAMFSILPPGGQLTPHADPLACSLRYHLGLATPNSKRCYINVDGREQHWVDGEDFIFDETYLHHVRNDTESSRLILMCDVERPMNLLGRVFNWGYSLLARTAMTPNTELDARGGASALFASVAPMLERGQLLKKQNRALYKLIKWVINLSLLGMLLGTVALLAQFVRWLIS